VAPPASVRGVLVGGYSLAPIPPGFSINDDRDMVQFSVRCHSLVPVSPDELEAWLEDRVDQIRVDASHGIIRLSRLTQGLPSGDVEIGWLIEFELPEEERVVWDRVRDTLMEIRRLGIHPTLLVPHDQTDRAGRRSQPAVATAEPARRASEVRRPLTSTHLGASGRPGIAAPVSGRRRSDDRHVDHP
jgi:hypothetical protein